MATEPCRMNAIVAAVLIVPTRMMEASGTAATSVAQLTSMSRTTE